MPHLRSCTRLFGLAALAVIVLIGPGCTSDAGQTKDEPSDSAEQTNSAKLSKRINACAIQRAKLERADQLLREFDNYFNLMQLALNQNSGTQRYAKRYGWDGEWNTQSIVQPRLVVDAEGVRIEGTAQTWPDLAEFLNRLNSTGRLKLGVRQAERVGRNSVEFTLAPVWSTVPLGGVNFDQKLFPAKNGRSLEEYADDLCDFGSDAAPEIATDVEGVTFETPADSTHGAWVHKTVRARAPAKKIRTFLNYTSKLDGLSVGFEGDEIVVDMYGMKLAPDFDAVEWLGREVKSARVDDSLASLPGVDELITWKQKNRFPVDVSRSLLGGVSWYRYRRIHRLYTKVAERHKQAALTNRLMERHTRALRASLCLTKAYTTPAEDEPQANTRPLNTAKLTFRVPTDGKVAGVDIDRFRLTTDGLVEWEVSSTDSATLGQVEQAFAACMNASDMKTSRAEKGGRIRWSAKATASADGLYSPRSTGVEPPRFEDGKDFVLAVRHRRQELRRELYRILDEQRRADVSEALQHLAPHDADFDELVRDVAELAQVFAVDLGELHQQPMATSGWTHMRPLAFQLEASASPADLLGFVTQLFDIDRPLVPAEMTITSTKDGKRLQVKARFYAFYGS